MAPTPWPSENIGFCVSKAILWGHISQPLTADDNPSHCCLRALFFPSLYILPSAPPSLHVSPCGCAHHHGALSRADSIKDLLCPDAAVPLVHVCHRSGGGLPACSPGALRLLHREFWRRGVGATDGAGQHPQCSLTPESLGWLQ